MTRKDFNVDRNKFFPDQCKDKRFTECTGETIADIAGNDFSIYSKVQMDPDFAYAAGFAVSGVTPCDQGEDPWNVMLGAVAYGSLPVTEQDWDASTKGELYVANFDHYSPADKQTALQFTMPGACKVNIDFDAVLDSINTTGLGVAIAMKWYGVCDMNSVLLPSNGAFSYHCVAAYGQKTVNGVPCITIKPWIGPDCGDHGYMYLTREEFQACVMGAYAFNPNASRWASLIGIAVTRFPYLMSYLPQLMKVQGFPPATYSIAKACLGQHLTLDPTVPNEVGCAEAVSYILQKAGITGIPQRGFDGTPDLYAWLSTNSQFKVVTTPQAGDVVISPTIGANHGHTGICLIHGIGSNDSSNGRFAENYSYDTWVTSFRNRGLSTYYFRPLC